MGKFYRMSVTVVKKGNLVDKVLGKGRFGGREEYYSMMKMTSYKR